jgi:predicted nucleotidyltransferase component of viral defense system
LETILAEKLETILSRNVQNTRMRDFYDIYMLTQSYSKKLDTEILQEAFRATSEKRDSEALFSQINLILEEVFTNSEIQRLWKNYQRKYPYASEVQWEDVCKAIQQLAQIIGA